jgi:hypothetical protein
MNKPNHICKNPSCKKEYYACNACDKTSGLSWRSVACSPECFLIYMDLVEKLNFKAIEEQNNSSGELT